MALNKSDYIKIRDAKLINLKLIILLLIYSFLIVKYVQMRALKIMYMFYFICLEFWGLYCSMIMSILVKIKNHNITRSTKDYRETILQLSICQVCQVCFLILKDTDFTSVLSKKKNWKIYNVFEKIKFSI